MIYSLKYDYYPFGMLVPHRTNPKNTVDNGGYRYGFQGQELDDKIKNSKGTSINYKYRMHDPRVGRFFAVDPLNHNYPFYSTYQFSANNPIGMLEIEGLEGIKHSEYDNSGKLIRHIITLNIAVITVDKIDNSIKENLFKIHSKKVARKKWREIKRERISSTYNSQSIERIKTILENGYKNQKNSAGEKVDFVFNVTELHIDSKDLSTESDLISKAKYELGTESNELRKHPLKLKNKTIKYKIAPLNILRNGTNPKNARGWNNNVLTIISMGDFDEEIILHETAHQLLTKTKKGAEHKLISKYSFKLTPEVVDEILKDAYEKKPDKNN